MRQFLEFLTEEVNHSCQMITYIDPAVTDQVDLDDEMITEFNRCMEIGLTDANPKECNDAKKEDLENAINTFLFNCVSLPWEEVPGPLKATIHEFECACCMVGCTNVCYPRE